MLGCEAAAAAASPKSWPAQVPACQAAAGALQVLYQVGCTSEEYVTRRLWLEASPPSCCYCIPGGKTCKLAPHGFYERLYPAGTRVRRYLCRRTGRTVSLLPDCFCSQCAGDVDRLEKLALAREGGQTAAEVAETFREEIGLQGALRWVRLRLGAVSSFLTLIWTLYPAHFEGVEPRVGDLRQHWQTDRVLVALRQIAESELPRIRPPLGLEPRPPNVPRAPPDKKTLGGPRRRPANPGF